ncbi:MAG: type I-B CRISPR-associated protein Cas5b [Cyanobacteria bacterium]|nr:type I-B CRISPR-associated protein Cas5b [Cyanobacteriota bacterium]
MEINELIIFDISGPFAHFKTFYTNSSSLSYSFPPRTSIIGLIAAICGYERDSYYEEMNIENYKITVSIKTPLKKSMYVMNYLYAKSRNDLNGSAGHTQIPLEVVLPSEIIEKNLKYRIYFAKKENGKQIIFNRFKEYLFSKKIAYPPYLGISEFIGKIEFIDLINKNNIEKITSNDYIQEINSVVNLKNIKEKSLIFKPDKNKTLNYLKEKAPLDFSNERFVKNFGYFIFEKNGNSLLLIPTENCYNIMYKDFNKEISENIIFME